MIIDTHTHIYDKAFDGDRDQAVERARAAGVRFMMCPAIDSGSHGRLFDLCRRHEGVCLPMMGLHPTSVNDNPAWREELALVEKYLASPPAGLKFHAVGEVGLDLYWSREWRKEQEEAFARQIELSLHYGSPLVIHTRDAWPQMTEMLSRYADRGLRGVMHSFSGTAEDYLAIKGFGDFMFGIGGPVTYRNSALPDIVRLMPMEDILLETDSPYLPPVPYRGKRNESSYLVNICDRVAEIKELDPAEVAAATTANAGRMFGLPD